MIVEKEQTGNPEPIHHGCVTGGREESAEVKAVISCPSDRFFKGKEDTHTKDQCFAISYFQHWDGIFFIQKTRLIIMWYGTEFI